MAKMHATGKNEDQLNTHAEHKNMNQYPIPHIQ